MLRAFCHLRRFISPAFGFLPGPFGCKTPKSADFDPALALPRQSFVGPAHQLAGRRATCIHCLKRDLSLPCVDLRHRYVEPAYCLQVRAGAAVLARSQAPILTLAQLNREPHWVCVHCARLPYWRL
jgi:hypothetical protein